MGHWTPTGIEPTDYDDDDKQISLYLGSHHFGKGCYLKFLYIIKGYNNISWRPLDPDAKILGLQPPKPSRSDVYVHM